ILTPVSVLAFERQQFRCHALAVHLVAAVSNGLANAGNTLLVNRRLLVELFRCLLQSLCFGAELNILARCHGGVAALDRIGQRIPLDSRPVGILNAVATPAVRQVGGTIGPVEIDNHDRNLEEISTLASSSAGHCKTLAIFPCKTDCVLHHNFYLSWACDPRPDHSSRSLVLDPDLATQCSI